MDREITEALREAAAVFAAQVLATSEEVSGGELGDEDDVSSQILGRIKAVAPSIDGPIVWSAALGSSGPNAVIKARHLTSRGSGSEEKFVGADIVLVVDIDVPGYRATKGILVQAKCVNSNGEARSSAERERLVSQCEDMLSVSSSSYVWTYGEGISVFSANAVLSARGVLSNVVDTYNPKIFFYDFLICWIGDPRIGSVTRPSLEALMQAVDADHGLILKGQARGG